MITITLTAQQAQHLNTLLQDMQTTFAANAQYIERIEAAPNVKQCQTMAATLWTHASFISDIREKLGAS